MNWHVFFNSKYEFIIPNHMNSYFRMIWIHISDRIIWIHIADTTYLSPVIEQAITPQKWNAEQSLKTDMKYIEKFVNHICNIVFDFWWIIVKIPYHPIIFRTLNTLVIFPFIKVLVANVQALFQNCILDYQLWSKRCRLQCSLSLIIKHGDTSIAPFYHF